MWGHWIGIVSIAARRRFQHRLDFAITTVVTMISGLLLYMVWRAVYAQGIHLPMSWQQLSTYVLVGQAMNMSRFSPAEQATTMGAARRLRNGQIELDLVKPRGLLAERFAEAVGLFAVELVSINLPSLLVFSVAFGISGPAGPPAAIAFPLSLLFGFLVSFSVNAIVLMVAFWTTNMLGVQLAKRSLLEIFGGTLIPIQFFPGWLRPVVELLPFQAMAGIPLSIYAGRITGLAIAWALVRQAVWAAALLAAATILWRLARARVVIYGG